MTKINNAIADLYKDTNTICSCFDFTLDEMREMIEQDASLRFDDLLADTGVGSKCTACLLNVEYGFSIISANSERRVASKSENTSKRKQKKIPFRQRIYSLIDSLPPMIPMVFESTMPVLFGRQIESNVWMANQSLLYNGEVCAPDFELRLVVRNAEGKQLSESSSLVKSDSAVRLNVSHALQDADPCEGLGIGSIQILQKSLSVGVRGTRRPQLEIVTPIAASALHGQAPNKFPNLSYFIAPYRENNESSFISIVSVSDHEMELDLHYPFELSGANSVVPTHTKVTVPPNGARLTELTLSDEQRNAMEAPFFTVQWSAPGKHKAHLITATKSLDRISLDHL